jgi:hypothetical protein
LFAFYRLNPKIRTNNMLGDIQNTIVPEQTARTVLEPYFQTLLDIINGAWNAWEEFGELAPHLRLPLSSSCRARFVYDHIVSRARAQFHGKNWVRMEEKRGLLVIHIQNLLTIRFKKFDSRLRSHIVQTRQQTLFSMQMEIDGFPKSTRLVAGYKLNELENAIETFAVTCPKGNNLEYVIEIPDSPGAVAFITPDPGPIKPADVIPRNVGPKAKKQGEVRNND